jgi:hypothetical protein
VSRFVYATDLIILFYFAFLQNIWLLVSYILPRHFVQQFKFGVKSTLAKTVSELVLLHTLLSLLQGDKIRKKSPNVSKNSPKSCQVKKGQNIYNKAQFESPKHLQQTTFETLKYLQPTTNHALKLLI